MDTGLLAAGRYGTDALRAARSRSAWSVLLPSMSAIISYRQLKIVRRSDMPLDTPKADVAGSLVPASGHRGGLAWAGSVQDGLGVPDVSGLDGAGRYVPDRRPSPQRLANRPFPRPPHPIAISRSFGFLQGHVFLRPTRGSQPHVDVFRVAPQKVLDLPRSMETRPMITQICSRMLCQ